ncbi:MAG: PD40 domain-containing protein [Flavobacteriales bacterium]|nr:PD40 domain-containing protein [Flavobacteriales bacterium]
MTRISGILIGALFTILAHAQGGDQQLRAKADGLFEQKNYIEALPLYSQLVSLNPSDRVLNYRFGTCLLFGGEEKDKAIGHLKFAVEDPGIPADAWFWLGRAYHLSYMFKEAQAAYQRYQGTASKKELEGFSVAALDKQCRNGQRLLNNLKEITVRNKVEVDDNEFFRFYDLSDIGGKIVVLPEELMSGLDKKSNERTLVYLPNNGAPIYFSSYGKDGKTGRDIYRTELMPEGRFAPPVKLAGYINTDQDEDYPFLHPDGKSFYFSSKGHNSMGGYDVFRSAYDKGLDVFGPPENMDFAVNTPDDDLFYLVDPENKEACFASGRDSEQGKLHVYRVSTAQMPVVLTVLKGTYASAFDPDDRKAHIMVEDATTREKVADVRTDMNGSYILSLPRSGQFRFAVECGPSGRTHTGLVDIPRSSSPRAYRQELELTRQGDLEKLVIHNYFDSPLDEDMIALMMDEIKRRARLDLSGERPEIVEAQETDVPVGDVMTQAGFTGDITLDQAVALAKDDAADLERKSYDLEMLGQEAYAIAMEAASESDRTARAAEDLVKAAEVAPTEEEKNATMVEAARIRQRSKEANMRARAALYTGQDLGSEALATRQRALAAGKLATDLSNTVAAKNDKATLPLLTTLKERLDTKAGPNGDLDPAERARRSLSEQEQEAAKQLRVANAKRAEENEFMDRIARTERERDETRNKGKQEELDRQIAEQKQQLSYLHKEVEESFTKAKEQEQRTAVLRGQASLTAHLTSTSERGAATDLSAQQVSGLGQRIAGNETRIGSLAIDERYDAQISSSTAEVEARSFDWDLASAGAETGEARRSTTARDGTDDATNTTGRTSTVISDVSPGQVKEAEVTEVILGSTAEELADTGRDEASGAVAIGDPDLDPEVTAAGLEDTRTERTDAGTNAIDERTVSPVADIASDTGTEQATADTEGPERNGAEMDNTGSALEGSGASDPLASDEVDAFILENRKAELEQALAAERNKARKDSLQASLDVVEERIRTNADDGAIVERTPVNEGTDTYGVDMTRTPITFYPDSKDEDIIAMLHADYAADKERLEAIGDTTLRAEALSGLELMLADSLRGEMVRQATILELSPEQSDVVLPKMERLRVMRQTHLKTADQYERMSKAPLAERTEPLDADRARPAPRAAVRYLDGQDPIADRFVAVQPDAQNVYASKLEHRSTKVDDAVAFKDADLERLDRLTAEIDSIEMGMNGLPRKEYDKQRREADKLIDERMIIRSDLGQRSAFLSKEEWRTATDSMKVLDKQLSTLGLAPDENLLLMAKGMGAEAGTLFDRAAGLRKRADRSEDILERDSLYRTAYAMELSALKEIDRALTVKNYLIGKDFRRGETLAYEQVASKVLGIDAPLYAEEQDAERAPTDPSIARTGHISDGTLTSQSGTEEGGSRTIAVSSGVPSGPVSVALTADGPESEAAIDRTDKGAETDGPATTGGTTLVGPTAVEAANATERARSEAIDEVERASAQVPAEALDPAVRYERFMTSESVVLAPEAMDPAYDPELLSIQAKAAVRNSAELEQRSLELADRATVLEDSAVTARKRDREELTILAVRTRSTSDSLHTASVLKSEEARSLELQRRDAEQAKVLRDRLVKYYYLSPEEQAMVVENADQSRYFQAKARALEQYDMAREAEEAAGINRNLAGTLRAQVESTRKDVAEGRITPAEGDARNEVLVTRSGLFEARADSLSNVAARLRGAAGINEGQATVMLQSVPEDRSTEWMALEMRARRTEALLAEARDQAGRQRNAAITPVDGTVDPTLSIAGTRTGNSIPASSERQAGATTRPVGTENNRPITESAPSGAVLAVGFPDELVTDIFELKDAGVRSAEPIPIDVRLPQGLVFKVQIGAFRNAIPEETFSDMTPVTGERLDNGIVRYTAGLFTGFEQASEAKDLVRDRGYRDAFVVAYRDGERIPLGVAMREARAERDLAVATTPVPTTPSNGTIRTDGSDADPNGTRPAARRAEGNTVLEPRTGQVPAQPTQPAVISAPIVIPIPEVSSTADDPTAKYASTADAILSEFNAAPGSAGYYNGADAAPARQVETIAGLFFTVQVGVYSKPVPLGRIFNITPLNTERTSTDKIRYTTGMYFDPEAARVRKDETVASGVKDAFVTAYLNGKRIPMQEASALLDKFGPAILAKP